MEFDIASATLLENPIESRGKKAVGEQGGSETSSDKTVLVQASMPQSQKKRFAEAAKAHGLGLSAFVRLACDEYIRQHGWDD